MALDSQYDGTISALRDRMKLELQAVMTQVIDARRNIDYECENAHQKYLDFHAKKLVDPATRIQNETARKEVEKALAQDEVVQNQQEQIKMLTEAMKLLMQDKRDGCGATKNGPQRGGGGGDKRRSKTPPPRRNRTPRGGSGKSTPKGQGHELSTDSSCINPIIHGQQTQKANNKRQKKERKATWQRQRRRTKRQEATRVKDALNERLHVQTLKGDAVEEPPQYLKLLLSLGPKYVPHPQPPHFVPRLKAIRHEC